jgi:HAD superfamily hydrolase (TIGR01509 family)
MPARKPLEAVILDLDGVITFTARVHAAAWKELFDNFLRRQSEKSGEKFQPFDVNFDYSQYVDGKPRLNGILSFLSARKIKIPLGSPANSHDATTAWGLATQKNELFRRKLQQFGVDVDREAVRFVRELRSYGVRIGLASSSKNAPLILETAKLSHLFDAVVDGNVSEFLNLRGKPEPDIFVQCLKELNANALPRNAAVVEDAISGVEAGRRGGFGLVLGIDRKRTGNLQNHGADWVIGSFENVTAERFIEGFASRSYAA